MAVEGVQFPVGDDGRRGTLAVNRAVWADAARPVDPGLADRIDTAAEWRSDYVAGVRAVTELGARSPDAARSIADAGLASARARLVFVRDGEEQPLVLAPDAAPAHALSTETVHGTGEPARELVVPYLGEALRGDALRRRIAAWKRDGIIEPSAGEALETVMAHPEWLRLPGRRIVVLGAGAETSPLAVLASWGAEVVALDLPIPAMWERLLSVAREGAGRVYFPVREGDGPTDGRAGANLITDVPEIARWLRGLAGDGGDPLVVGFYVYADGAAHVQATAAADVLMTDLAGQGHEIAVAYVGTPSDCYLVPMDVVEDSSARRDARGPRRHLEEGLRLASGGRLYAPAYDRVHRSGDGRRDWGVADALVGRQGPNYALAKRLQRWRATAQWAAGGVAAFNVAPPAWTRSVTKNRLLAAGYHGARHVGMEVFSPDTMRTLMTALLVHDLHTGSAGDATEHPERLVARGAVHGGYWRRPYEIRSTLVFTAVLGIPRAYIPGLRFR